MKFKITFPKSVEPIEPPGILTDARAKIIWGESAESVRDFLTSNGMSAAGADEKIEKFLTERDATIRAVGLKYVFAGAILIISSAFTLFCFFWKNTDLASNYRGRDPEFGFAILAGIYGLWKLVKGIIDFACPQFIKESIPDMNEDDEDEN